MIPDKLIFEMNWNLSTASWRREAHRAEIRRRVDDNTQADKMPIETAAARLELAAQPAESNTVIARIAGEVLVGTRNPAANWVPGDTLEQLAGLPFLASQTTPGTFRPDGQASEVAHQETGADLRWPPAMRISDQSV